MDLMRPPALGAIQGRVRNPPKLSPNVSAQRLRVNGNEQRRTAVSYRMMRTSMEALMKFRPSVIVAVAGVVVIGALSVEAQQVTKENVPGVTNFARLETTVACGGATKPEAVAGIKKMGFASIINLRLATEAGAMV